MLWRFGRVGVRVNSVEVVSVRKAVEATGRASMVRRTARAMGWVRVEVSMVGGGRGGVRCRERGMCVSVSGRPRKMCFECRDCGDYGATGAVAVGTVQVFKLQTSKYEMLYDSAIMTHVNTRLRSDDDNNDSLQASVYCTTIFDLTDIFMLKLIPSFSFTSFECEIVQ